MTAIGLSTRKTEIQEHAARVILADFTTYRREVLSSDDVDAMRKLVEMEMRLIGAEPDKKQDQHAHLPTFNFVFHQGGVQATLQQVEVVQAEAPSPAKETRLLEASTAKPPMALDLDGLLESIDADLKDT